jgi:hypothetical protein
MDVICIVDEADCVMLTAVALVVNLNVGDTVSFSGTFKVFVNPVATAVTTNVEVPAVALAFETIVRVVVPVPAAMLGVENPAVTPLGSPLTVKPSTEGNLPCGLAQVTRTLVAWPATIVTLAGLAANKQLRGMALIVKETVAVWVCPKLVAVTVIG